MTPASVEFVADGSTAFSTGVKAFVDFRCPGNDDVAVLGSLPRHSISSCLPNDSEAFQLVCAGAIGLAIQVFRLFRFLADLFYFALAFHNRLSVIRGVQQPTTFGGSCR